MNKYQVSVRRVPAQYVHFLYTRSHLSELPGCKSIISTGIFTLSYLNSAQHISVIEFCCEQQQKINGLYKIDLQFCSY